MNLQQTFHNGKRWLPLIPWMILIGLALGITQTRVVQAATINVACNVTDLVNAINTANTNGEADTLNLAAGCTYTLTATLDILPDGGNPLTIEGNGATLSGNNTVRVFFVNPGATLNLNAATVSNGTTTGSGGGIRNFDGILTLTNSIVSNNTAFDSSGGGISVTGGMVTLINSTVSGNTNSDFGGGGIFNDSGTVTLIDSTVSGNNANLDGGGINNAGTLTLTNSSVSNNTTNSFGGGILNTGTLTLSNSTIVGNSAVDGGGIFNRNFGTITLSNSTLSGNTAVNGGGINNAGTLTLTNSSASNNSATNVGGGIANMLNGTLTLTNSTVSGNTADGEGGGIFNVSLNMLTLSNSTLSGNTASLGGGFYNNGTLTLTNSSVSNNTTNSFGGGIFNDSNGRATLTNSTVVGNTSTNGSGGGITNMGTALMSNSTIANNNRLGIEGMPGGTLALANSILANNGVDCAVFQVSLLVLSGGNLVEDGSCGAAVLTGDPLLGGLTGSPAHFPLLPGSPAIDAGDNSLCPATDQRGAARPFDGDGDGTATCDLGSYELDTVAPPITPTPTSPSSGTATPPPPGATEATIPPPPDTPRCEDLNFVVDGVVRASVSDALDYAVFCRVLYANGAPGQWLGGDLYNAGSIGHQGVLDLGVLQAVDVYSPVGMTSFDGGVEICLRGQGTLIFLAARNAPRIAEVIGEHTASNFPGFTCATLFEPGTLVLVRENPAG